MNIELSDPKNKYYSRVIQKEKRIKLPKKEISFFITEDCNLNCTYCYLPGKNNKNRMSFDIARKAIDYILNNEEASPEPQLVLDFIGGEPLLEIDLIDQIVDYFKITAYKKKHRWAKNYNIMMTSNGTLFKKRKFEQFLSKNLENYFLAVSIDGIKDKHDASRIYKGNGKGSYDDVIENFNHLRKLTSNISLKATFSREDLKYLKSSVIHLHEIANEYEIYANIVYEDVWKDGDDKLYESQLIELADYVIDNNLHETMKVSFFNEFTGIGKPYHRDQLDGHWCHCGHQISVGPDGNFYPCNRFHEVSMFKHKIRTTGNVDDGIDFDKLRPFRVLNLANCSESKCIECEVASGCGMCSGLSYDESQTGTVFSRSTNICAMHKARTRAYKYYWDRLEKEKNYKQEKTSFYILQLKNPMNVLNIMLSSDSPQICGYPRNKSRMESIDVETLKKYLELCKKRDCFVNLIYPSTPLDKEYLGFLDGLEVQKTIPYTNQKDVYKLEDGAVFIVSLGQVLHPDFSCINAILLVDFKDISKLSDYVYRLFKQGISRLNVIFDLSEISIDMDFDIYREQLERLSDVLFEYYKSGQIKYLNVLTDILNLADMNNCNAGITHFTLGPDEKLYLCPAFYYLNMPYDESKHFKPSDKMTGQIEFKNAVICKACDAYHCRRCVFDNFQKTAEYNIPGEVQCVISHIERDVSRKLQERLITELNINSFKNTVVEIEYIDPFTQAKIW